LKLNSNPVIPCLVLRLFEGLWVDSNEPKANPILLLPQNTSLGVSMAAVLHLIPSRTQKLSPPTANLVPRKLGAKIARCPLFKINPPWLWLIIKARTRAVFFVRRHHSNLPD